MSGKTVRIDTLGGRCYIRYLFLPLHPSPEFVAVTGFKIKILGALSVVGVL
ncbi:hypothetical protein [Desulfosarcina sp. BuS5]|uniref:hypothetical protein n=1 Tax=Desulfosarcina sp. BuS5 TaxID=933262 RepID=UPI0012F82C77|nr:hypothetical protein [Desulfosarcina sp. BuS5]